MIHYIKNHKLLLLGEISSATFHAIFDALLAFAMGYMTNSAIDGKLNDLLYSAIYCVICLIAIYVLYLLEINFRKKLSGKCICEIKHDIYTVLVDRGISSLHDKEDSYYLNLLQGDIDLLERDYFDSLWRAINLTIQTLFCMVALFFVSAKLFLIFSVLCIIPQLTSRGFQKPLSNIKDSFSKQNARSIQVGKEFIGGFDTLLFFSNHERFISRLLKEDKELEKKRKEKDVSQIKVSYGITTINMIAQILCMAAAAYFVAIGEIRFGALTTSTQLLNYTFTPLNTVINCALAVLSTNKIREKVIELVHSPGAKGNKKFIPGNIIFSNVTLGYHDKNVLSDFSYTFTLGRKYALIGSSGSGKSTLMKALLGSANVSKGNITIGSIDVNEISPYELHKNILYVPQIPYLFEGTVLENISFFGDDSRSLQSAKDASLPIELLESPAGGDRGNMLSGGEMTRISIARALCSDASILIFDEPTSALDPTTAKEIENLILSIPNKTVIVVTHNWSKDYLERFDDTINISNVTL